MNTAVGDLLDRAPGANGPEVEVDFGRPELAWQELGRMLSALNGFTVFNAGVQVFRAGEQGLGWDISRWNIEDVWKTTYGGLAGDLFCFAQDLIGNQFAVDQQAQVVRFDAETGRRITLGASLDDWAEWLLAEPDLRGGDELARQWQGDNGALTPTQRLLPRTLLVAGGTLEPSNLKASEADAAMVIRGPIATQVHDLPPGTTISFRVI